MQRPSNYKDGMSLGQYIRHTREQMDITLTAFAKTLGISKSYLSDVERGNRTISKSNLAHLAYRFIRYFPEIVDGITNEKQFQTMFQFLLIIGQMMSYEYECLYSISTILDEPKIKKKDKLKSIKLEVEVMFLLDYFSWEVDRDTKK